jgi:hypothetical protein
MTDTTKPVYSVDINRTVMKDGKPVYKADTRYQALYMAAMLTEIEEKSEGK